MEYRRRPRRFGNFRLNRVRLNPGLINFKPGHLKLWVVAATALLIIFLCYVFVNAQLMPALKSMTDIRINALVSDAMYSTVLDQIAAGALDEPFLAAKTDAGQVYSSELNNRELTRFAADCAQIAQEKLIEYGKQGIKVPMGTVSGAAIFAGLGPNITMTFCPETNTQAFFSSEFTSAGINQTLHRVMLRLEAQIAVALPGETMTIISYVDVPIAEQVIVGHVPDTYVGINQDNSALNLVPQQ